MRWAFSVSVIFLLFIIGCDKANSILPEKQLKVAELDTEELIPIDFKDTTYQDVAMFAKDTITGDGWRIKYLVKDDSTRYTDIYIQWEKGNIKRVKNCGNVLEMRRYFIPGFVKDNQDYLFFEHGCATGCSAVLTLPKNVKDAAEDFNFILDYRIDKGQIVFIDEESFSSDTLSISATDLKKHITKTSKFKNRCSMTMENSCINTVIFKHKEIIIAGTFIDKYGNNVKEVRSIEF